MDKTEVIAKVKDKLFNKRIVVSADPSKIYKDVDKRFFYLMKLVNEGSERIIEDEEEGWGLGKHEREQIHKKTKLYEEEMKLLAEFRAKYKKFGK
ncbi:hypothetical protein N9948_01280 [bacterium]|nr:hypothetical protein [bacterium]